MANVKCPSCGSTNVEQIDTDKYQCPYCGKTFFARESLPDSPSSIAAIPDDTPSEGLNWLSFFVPIVGLILFFVKKAEAPISAMSYLKWGAIGFTVGIVLQIIMTLLGLCL